MKVKIYQINPEKDADRIRFFSYDDTIKIKGRIDASIYRTVYDGNVDCGDLEDVFGLLNTTCPIGYNGHSLAVSDIVEVVEPVDNIHGFYFCDIIGYRKTDFDSSKAEPMSGKKMVVVEPGRPAYAAVIGDDLKSLQKAVDGYIECTYPFEDNAFVIGNEEAKLISMKGNRHINGAIYAGPLLIAGDDGAGGTVDLTDEQIRLYAEMFAEPEEITDEQVQADTGFVFFSVS